MSEIYSISSTDVYVANPCLHNYMYLRSSLLGRCMQINCINRLMTCNELRTVNIQANAMVFPLIANRPNIHVSPSNGSSITVAFNKVL